MAKKNDNATSTEVQPITETKEDTTWKDKPNEQIRRVFRATNPLTKVELATLNRKKRIVGGTEYPAQFLTISVNPAAQYVLSEQFEPDEYQEQLKALRSCEKQGMVVEMPPHWEGKLYVEPAPLTPAEVIAEKLRIENEGLLAKIKELEERKTKDE